MESFRKQSFEVWHHYYESPKSKERFTTEQLDELNRVQLDNQYRKRNQIPFPYQLRAWRERFGLSASRMSLLLDFGLNQYRKYEEGEIPSDSNAAYLRLAQDSAILRRLVEAKRSELRTSEYDRVIGLLSSATPSVGDAVSRTKSEFWDETAQPGSLTGYSVPNFEKFAQMVLYFYCSGLKKLFTVKLLKLLFYADFYHFQQTGRSISGASYRAIPYGPVPNEYQIQIGLLIHTGYLTQNLVTVKDQEEPVISYVPVASKANRKVFSETEQAALDAVVKRLAFRPTAEIVDRVHQEKAWTENRETMKLIDYQQFGFMLQPLPAQTR